MNNLIFALGFCLFISCQNKTSVDQEGPVIQKSDLVKLKWIEGNWEGIYNGQPFYEVYKMVNDSTLRITSYANIGTDAVMSSHDNLTWKASGYYLGNDLNYKVVAIDDKEIKMIPNKNAANEVVWRYVNDSTWNAILEGTTDTNNYMMKRVPPRIDSLLTYYEAREDSLRNK